jgi:ribosomal protein S12 methylthiotransferase
MAIQQKISTRKLRARAGEEATLLLDGPSRDTEWLWEGRLEGMAPDIDGKVYITEFPEESEPRPGRLARVRISRSTDYDLVARVEAFLDKAPAEAQPVSASGVLRVLG